MSDYITKSTLKSDYNLTDALIKKLGEPDKTAPNPHYRKAAPMQLYLRTRVEQWVKENAELVAKVVERRKVRPLKPRPEPPPPIVYSTPGPEYRKTTRQVGDKWSWSVYQSSSVRVLKTGWADSQAEAEAACQAVIREAETQKWLDFGERFER